MRICRFLPLATPGQGDDPGGCVGPYGIATRHFQWVDAPGACVGLLDGDLGIVDLTAAGFPPLAAMLELEDLAQQLTACLDLPRPRIPLSSVRLLAPVESQEVWAAGVTYLRSKTARMEESEFSASAYDRVYAAERPELFFKALAEKVVHPGEPVGIRRDSRWSVPEPELALVFNSRGQFVGCTVGNDVSARDIEGENLLYLPQAKVYCRSCALGPFLVVGVDEATVRGWRIGIEIRRDGGVVFAGETEAGRLKRRFDELGSFLFRCQEFPAGVVLLSGTGIVPPDDFSLRAGDVVRIEIAGIGTLENPVIEV